MHVRATEGTIVCMYQHALIAQAPPKPQWQDWQDTADWGKRRGKWGKPNPKRAKTDTKKHPVSQMQEMGPLR